MELRYQPHRKRGQWVVYWKSAWTGKRHHRGFASEDFAREFMTAMQNIVAKEQEVIKKRRTQKKTVRQELSVAELFRQYFTVALKNPVTIQQAQYHAAHILRMFEKRQAALITPEDILRFIEAQKVRGLQQSTINRRVSILRTALSWAVKAGILNKHSLNSLRLPQAHSQRITPPTPQELRRIFQVAAPHLQRVIALGVYCGARIGRSELFRLRWEDVDIENGMIHMPNADKGARESSRELPIKECLIPLLKAWKEEDRAKGILFVIHWKGQAVRSVNKAWHTALRKAGICRRITPYTLRHAYATYSVQGGAKLKTLAKLMGHKDETMILRTYQHVLDKQERETVEAMPDVLLLEKKLPKPKRRSLRPKTPVHPLGVFPFFLPPQCTPLWLSFG